MAQSVPIRASTAEGGGRITAVHREGAYACLPQGQHRQAKHQRHRPPHPGRAPLCQPRELAAQAKAHTASKPQIPQIAQRRHHRTIPIRCRTRPSIQPAAITNPAANMADRNKAAQICTVWP